MDVDEGGILQKAFYIFEDDEELDFNLPPTSGNEYLRRVQLETKQCPVIKVAEMDTSRFLSNQTFCVSGSTGCLPAPKGFAPSRFWQQTQIADFSEVRQKLSNFKLKTTRSKAASPIKLPRIDDDIGWCQLCFGGRINGIQENISSSKAHSASEKMLKEMNEINKETGIPPLLSIVSSMSQLLIEQVLSYHTSWLEVTGFTSQQGRWFYALLACLEKPLTPEACSSLRSLARVCCKLRASLSSQDDPALVAMNLIICLIAHYFDQGDLADNPLM